MNVSIKEMAEKLLLWDEYTKNSCNIKSKMLYYKWVMKDAKIQTNQNKIE